MRPKNSLQLAPGIWLAAGWCTALLLYAVTAAPSIVELFDDSLEFQLVAPTFGIAHPTGYPLYTLLGALWSRFLFPFGNWAWRMNLLNALFAAGAVALLLRLTLRLTCGVEERVDGWAALGAALTFGLGGVWWRQATLAEVYPLHILMLALIFSLAIGINRTQGEGPGMRFDQRMTWLALTAGFSLTHHATAALVLPGLAGYLLLSVPRLRRLRSFRGRWLVALLAPLTLYAYLPLRAQMGVRDLNQSYVHSLQGFLDHVLARRYGSFFVANQLTAYDSWHDWLALLHSQLGWVGWILFILGLPWLMTRRRRPAPAWLFVAIVLLMNLLFAVNYRVGDPEVFFLPVLFCMALFVGAGIGSLGRLTPAPLNRLLQPFAVLLLIVGVWPGWEQVDRSDDWAIHDYAVAMAKVDFPEQSYVVGLEGEMTALQYMQRANGLGLNAIPVVADDPGQRSQIVAQQMAAGKSTFLTREVAGIESLYSFSGHGPLIRVWPRGRSVIEAPPIPLHPNPGAVALQLEGYRLTRLDQAGGPALEVVYYWRSQGELETDYKLSLRILQADGSPLIDAQGNPLQRDLFPLRQAAGTSDWVPGERIRDVHTIPLQRAQLADASELLTILYAADTLVEAGRWTIDLRPALTP